MPVVNDDERKLQVAVNILAVFINNETDYDFMEDCLQLELGMSYNDVIRFVQENSHD